MKNTELNFRAFLESRGLKLTDERKRVWKAVSARSGHFDADTLLYELRRGGSPVSRGTVYRSIPLLVEAGILRPVAFTERHAHYERVLPARHHEHLICLRCGRILEFHQLRLEKELARACRVNRFYPVGHKVEVTGYCAACAARSRA